jgi:flagellar basal body rod protein FlgG
VKQFFPILMFVGVFGLGVLADRWIVSPANSSAVGELDSDSEAVAVVSAGSSDDGGINTVTAPFSPIEAATAVVTQGDSGVSLASFEEFAETRPAAAEDVPSVRPSRKVSREQVRAVITERFPDLSPEAVAGWTDTYEGTPPDELDLLLEQRHGLPSILPGKSFLSKASSEFGKLQPTPTGTPGLFANAAMIVHQNLLHVTTPGFRRRRIVTHPQSFSSATEFADGLQHRDVFDFQPGEINSSQHPLHMAIVDHPELMFQLEPGNLLTRSGAFTRLADGRLGIETGDGTAALSAQINIPENAGAIFVSTTGAVRFNDSRGEIQSVGRLKLAVVRGLGDLQSVNGVFFTTSTDPSAIPMAEGTPVMTNALESSNVDIDYEWKLADHYARLNRL